MNGTFAPKGKMCGAIMADWLFRIKKIDLGPKCVYGLLVNFAHENYHYCQISQTVIAEKLGKSVRSVQNYIDKLVELGLIKVVSAGSGCANQYHFLQSNLIDLRVEHPVQPSAPALGQTPENVSQGYEESAGVGDDTVAYIKILKSILKSLNTPPIVPRSISKFQPATPHVVGGGFLSSAESKKSDEAFNRLWAMWPRKEAQASALTEWRRLWFSGQLPPVEALLQKVEHLKNNDRAWIRGFAPYLVTWLRDCRWLDAAPDPAPEPAVATVANGIGKEDVPMSVEEIRAAYYKRKQEQENAPLPFCHKSQNGLSPLSATNFQFIASRHKENRYGIGQG